jgi:hypothetical protein
MKIPVDEKNLINIRSIMVHIFIVEEKTELLTPLSICKACFTNVKAI